jgi:hypothetical protein
MSSKQNSRKNNTAKRTKHGKRLDVSKISSIAANSLQSDFLVLPKWCQRNLITTLHQKAPYAFEGIGDSVSVESEKQSQQGREKASVVIETGSSRGKNVKSAKAPVSGDLVEKSSRAPGAAPSKLKKLKGFMRPEVCNLAFAQRLAAPAYVSVDGSTRNGDLSILSSALSAVKRGAEAGFEVAHVTKELSESRVSKENFARLWPSKHTVRLTVVNRFKAGKVEQKDVQMVGDKYCLSTDIELAKTMRKFPDDVTTSKQRCEYFSSLDSSNILSACPFHVAIKSEPAPVFNKDLVQSFIEGEEKDYSEMCPFVHAHGKHGLIILYWIPFSVTTLRWGFAGNSDEDSVHSVKAIKATPPRIRKRRRLSVSRETIEEGMEG